jgi:hypothetical protein
MIEEHTLPSGTPRFLITKGTFLYEDVESKKRYLVRPDLSRIELEKAEIFEGQPLIAEAPNKVILPFRLANGESVTAVCYLKQSEQEPL